MDDSHQLSECPLSVHHLPVPAVHLPIYLDSDIYIERGEVNGEGEKGETFTELQKEFRTFNVLSSLFLKGSLLYGKTSVEIIVAI